MIRFSSKFQVRHFILMNGLMLGLVLACCACRSSTSMEAQDTKLYAPTWESLETHQAPDWFKDAKLGIFVVWGPYSIPAWRPGNGGYAEWFPSNMYADTSSYYPWMRERFGASPPEFGYKDICRNFKGENFDPDLWAKLFKRSGAKYVIQIAEFHGGFAMWDSELTDWCTMKTGPERDIVGEIGKAVRKQGMRYGVSTHRERHPGFYARERYAIQSSPHEDIAEEIRRDPSAEALYGPFEYSDAFINDYLDRWKELEYKYRPDFMWIDDIPIFYWTGESRDHPQTKKFQEVFKQMIAGYFNAAQGWGKEVYLNNKGRNPNWPTYLGALSWDNMNVGQIPEQAWESPATMSTSYGFCEQEETGDSYRTVQELVQLLCDVVSKNGTLLLTVGPKGDGSIPRRQQERLIAMGQWLQVNGEAIYGSRTWKVFGEGEGEPGPVRRHSVPIRPREIRYTQKGRVLYAMSLNRPDLPLVLTSTAAYDKGAVKNITLLGSKQKIAWHTSDQGIVIDGPEELQGEHVWTFRIEKNPRH